MNRLLKRQVSRFLPDIDPEDPNFKAFLNAIDDAYQNYEDQYAHIERALDLSSRELFKKNKELIAYNERLEKLVEERTSQVQRLALVAQKTQNAVIIANDLGEAVWANDAFVRITGYEVEELMGKKPGRLLQGPKTDPFTVKAIGEAIREKRPFEGEIYNYNKSGQGYWLNLSIAPIIGENDDFQGFIAIESDITQSKLQQEKIEESEARFRFVINSLKEVVFQTNLDSQWIFLNPAWEEMTGFSVEESLHDQVSSFLLEEDIPQCKSIFMKLMEGKAEYVREVVRFKTKSGDFRYVDIFVRLTIGSNGEASGLSGTLNDVTEKTLAEMRLNDTLRFQNAILDGIHNAKIAIDLDGRIRTFNKGAEKMFGLKATEFTGQKTLVDLFSVMKFKHPKQKIKLSDNRELVKQLEGLFQQNRFEDVEIQYKDAFNRSRWLTLTMSNLIDEFQHITGHLLILTDTTEKKEAREQLLLTQSLIDHSSDAIQISDEKGYFIFVNSKAAEGLGYDRHELLKMHVQDVEDLFKEPGSWESHVLELKRIGSTLIEGMNKRKNGELFPVEANVRYLSLEGKGYIMAIIRDISERKKTEEEILKRQMLLNEAQAIAHIGSWEYYLHNQQVLWSDELYNIFGIEKKQVSLQDYFQIIHPEQISPFRQTIEKVFTEKKEQSIEHRIITPRGEEKYILGIGKPVFNEAGDVVALRGTAQDITERKRFEEHLLYNEKLLNTVNNISFTLLNSQNLSQSVEQALEYAGKIVEADRVYIFENREEEGILLSSQRFEWVKGGVSVQLDNPDLQDIPMSDIGYKRWMDAFLEGNCIKGLVKDFPESEKPLLEEQDIKSLLVLPIYVSDVLWGFVGFDDCTREKVWTSAEENILSNLANSLGSYLVREASEAKLAQSERRFRSLVQNSSDITTVIAPNGTIQYMSPSFYRMFGYEEDSLLGRNVFELVHPEDVEKSIFEFNYGIQTGGVSDPINFRYRKADGEYLYLEAVGNNLVEDESVNAIVVNARDVTERDRAQKEILQTKEFYERILHSIPLDVVVFDAEHKYKFINSTAIKNKERREWAIGHDDFEYCKKYNRPLHVAEQRRKEFNQVISTNRHIEYEEQLEIPESEPIWRLRRLFPVEDGSGEIAYVIGYGVDITERKVNEEKLRILNDRMQLATQAAGFGVWDWNVKLNSLVWDDTLYELFGVEKNQFSNNFEAWAATLHPDDKERAFADVQEALKGNKDFSSEFRIVKGGHEIRHIAGKANVYRDANGTAVRMLGVNWDITESKESESKLMAYTQDLEKINKELDQFAYVVSHDLKAPLRAINNLSLWIEEDIQDVLTGDTKDQFKMLRGRVQRMESLINGILNYSRAGRMKTNPVKIDLADFIPDLISLLGTPDNFKVQIQSGLPVILAEKVALEQVFSNFISNAIKYNSNPEPELKINWKDDGRYWHFSVSDNGPGIDKEYHDKIFVIFQTLNARDKVESTGVGLAIVKKIIEDKGGKCWVESALGVGSTFHFTWPKNA